MSELEIEVAALISILAQIRDLSTGYPKGHATERLAKVHQLAKNAVSKPC